MKREKLIAARHRHELSQQEAADLVGVTWLAYNKWENDVSRPHPANLRRLCEVFEASAEELGLAETTMTRREAILAISGTILGVEELMRSSEALAQCAIGIPSLWDLYFAGKMEQVATILPMYRSYLTALVQQSSPLQNHAFALASQVHQLIAEVATDQEDHNSALISSQEALLYAQSAGDANLQVASLMRQANIFFHRKMATKSLQAYQHAASIMGQASPLLQGRIHVGLAEVHGMRGEKQDALRAIGQAHDCFPDNPQLDQAYGYTHINEYELHVFGEGQTRLYLGQPKEALASFGHIVESMGPQIDPLPAVDLMYYQGEAATAMGDLETAARHVEDGALLAKKINSRLYFNKIAVTYRDMSQKWGNDVRVTALADLFQPW